jgi:two-component system, chemotaxis family, protein-glutamate methylesterase/glutaminase
MTRSTKVLVVDDSAVIRGLLTRILSQDPQIEVLGTAMHGGAALAWLKNQTVDVVLLDVEMPVMDGIETLRRIQQLPDPPKVIMASSLTVAGAKISLLALSLGASACIAKPTGVTAADAVQVISRELIPLVKNLGNGTAATKKTESAEAAKRPSPIFCRKSKPAVPPSLLVVGASTGGPNALNRLLQDLGPDFSVPTLIVQHMPPMFTAMMASHLQNDCQRRVKEAEHLEFVQPGVTYVAPGDFHLEVVRSGLTYQLQLNQLPDEHFCRPSVNPLFRTAARATGGKVLAVMLTGMGSDGIEGSRDIADQGGYIIAQDEASSVVWGMPGAVAQAGLANEVLPLPQIGRRVSQLCSSSPAQVIHS